MASSLSSFVNNLAEGIHKINCKYKHDETCKTCGIKHKDGNYFLENTNFKDDLIEYRCLCCNNNYQKILSLLEKEDFYSHLNIEDVTDANYMHEKRVCKNFEIKNLGKYHDFYVRSDSLLLADVFENFRNMSLEIYELDPVRFPTTSGLPRQAALKNYKVKLGLLTDTDMLLMVEKSIR